MLTPKGYKALSIRIPKPMEHPPYPLRKGDLELCPRGKSVYEVKSSPPSSSSVSLSALV